MIHEAIFNAGENVVTVNGLVQWDQNQIVKISGLNLDRLVEIHFENKILGAALVRWGIKDEQGNTMVSIPNDILTMPHDFTAWVVVVEEDERKTIKSIKFPLVLRDIPAYHEFINDDATYNALNELNQYVTETYEEIVKIANETKQAQIDHEQKMDANYNSFTTEMNENFQKKATELTELVHDLTDGVTIVKAQNVTVTPAMWTNTGGRWVGKITDEKVGTNSVVNVILKDEYESKVAEYDIQSITESFTGYFEIYATKQPTANLVIDYSMM